MNQERKRILALLSEGKITADEAEEQLRNAGLGITLSKEETKSVANALVHTVTSKDVGKYAAASGLSFIPVVGNVVAGAIMASTCYSITYAAGMIYLKAIERLMDQNQVNRQMTGDNVAAMASQIAATEDMAQIFADAQKNYETDKEEKGEDHP